MHRCHDIDGADPYGAGSSRLARFARSYIVCRKEPHERVCSSERTRLGAGRLQPREDLPLHRQVALNVAMRDCRALVAVS